MNAPKLADSESQHPRGRSVVHIKFFKPGEPIESFCKALEDDVIPAWDEFRTNARDVAAKREDQLGVRQCAAQL